MTYYDLVFNGELSHGSDKTTVIPQLVKKFALDEDVARRLLETRSTVKMKKRLSHEKARVYREALEKIGLIVDITPAVSEELQADEEDNQNPYATPQSSVKPDSTEKNLHQPQSVSAGRGWHWFIRSFWHLTRNPWLWLGCVTISLTTTFVINLIPILGFILMSVLSPIFSAGFMVIAEHQHKDTPPGFRNLFDGFSTDAGQLAIVGVFYLAGTLLIFLFIFLIGGGALLSLDGLDNLQSQDPEAMQMLFTQLPILGLILLVALGLFIPLLMAYWFAPALVILDKQTAIVAMKLSFVACLRNMLAFLVYGLVGVVLLTLALIPIVILLVAVAMISAQISVIIVSILPILILIGVFTALVYASMYAGYRDIFC